MRPMMRLSRNAARAMVTMISAALLIGGCAQTGPSASPGTLQVLATTTVFADIVGEVGGSRITVSSIVPPGVGPEDYEPRTGDSKRLADAQLIVSNGVGLDDFLDGLLTSTAAQAARLVLGEGIPTIETEGQPNPHFWLDPSLVVAQYLPKIVAKLSELDPAGETSFEENAATYGKQLEDLDVTLKAKVAEIPQANRKLVTFHDAFPYFARHFGFEMIGVIVENVGQDPSAGELAALVEKVETARVKAVFSEAQFSPKLAETLAGEAGVEKVVTTLYNDALGDPPADTYIGMMRWNVEQVVDALK